MPMANTASMSIRELIKKKAPTSLYFIFSAHGSKYCIHSSAILKATSPKMLYQMERIC